MTVEINRIKWKCRRGMRELDLLLREFASQHLEKLNNTEAKIVDAPPITATSSWVAYPKAAKSTRAPVTTKAMPPHHFGRLSEDSCSWRGRRSFSLCEVFCRMTPALVSTDARTDRHDPSSFPYENGITGDRGNANVGQMNLDRPG